jgi:hypothetical protein
MGAGMSARLLTAILAMTRAWLRLYTSGLPADVAIARRAEIDSDLWEMEHDDDLAGTWQHPIVALRRLTAGMADDVGWRVDVAPPGEQVVSRRLMALVAASVIVASLWSVPPLLVKGRRELEACAETADTPTSTAELRHEVLRCAGAFFVRR